MPIVKLDNLYVDMNAITAWREPYAGIPRGSGVFEFYIGSQVFFVTYTSLAEAVENFEFIRTFKI